MAVQMTGILLGLFHLCGKQDWSDSPSLEKRARCRDLFQWLVVRDRWHLTAILRCQVRIPGLALGMAGRLRHSARRGSHLDRPNRKIVSK